MPLLTSHTHPLCIDVVDVPDGGQIGMTLCPGKKQPNSVSGHWQRDLATDLKAVADWGATAVVTLMEPKELEWVAVADMGEMVESLGMDWYHLPIRDVQPPGMRFENRWVLYGLLLRRRLRRGEKVLIHCRGGLGRTGTVAGRLLAELGMRPSAAVAAVRAARPGTIETPAQEAHVLAARVPQQDEAFLDRTLGCLLGGALGDGFGYAVEFDSLQQILRQHGPDGLQEPVLKQGRLQVSDDTQMTLFTLEAVAHVKEGAVIDDFIAGLRDAYGDWLDTQGMQPAGYKRKGTLASRPALRHLRAPGNTCVSALRAGGHGTPERPINNSKGCGAVMRIAPLAWAAGLPRAQRFDLAARAGALTHGHPDGWASAGMLAVLLAELFAGRALPQALEQAQADTLAVLTKASVRADTPAIAARAGYLAKRLHTKPQRAIAELGQGWVGEEALAIALYAVLSAGRFEDAVRRAANHDGDSDSTASIAGQIWGAWKGVQALPMAWVRRLDVLPECLHGIGELAARGYAAAPTAAMRLPAVTDPATKTAVTILEMVHVLHRRGYQRLRIAPGMAPSGCCWRVSVASADNFLPDNGAMLREFDQAVHHTTGNGIYPFAWRDAEGQSPETLADRFLARAPQIAERGKGADWAYAGWYLEVLRLAERGLFPIAYADWHEKPDPRYLALSGSGTPTQRRLLAPPLPVLEQVHPRESLPPPPTPAADDDTQEDDDSVDYRDMDLHLLDLSEDTDRQVALIAFYHQWEPALVLFTAKVWDSLTEPRAPKIAAMAKTLGIAGADKLALSKILRRYLQDTEAALEAADQDGPKSDEELSIEAALDALADSMQQLNYTLITQAERWSRLLNGEPMDPDLTTAPTPSATVIDGPWLRP